MTYQGHSWGAWLTDEVEVTTLSSHAFTSSTTRKYTEKSVKRECKRCFLIQSKEEAQGIADGKHKEIKCLT